MAYKIKVKPKVFQDMKDKAIISIYSKKFKRKGKLTNYELKKYKEAFFRYYRIPLIFQ
jgi:hypothetical protein